MAETKTVAKAAGLLIAANLASRVLGFLRETLIAGFYGQQGTTDAYVRAFILPDLLYWMLMGGVLGSSLIPVLSEYIAKGEEKEGWRVVSAAGNLIFLCLSILTLAGLVLTPWFVRLWAPDLQPELVGLTVHLTRVLLIQPLFMSFAGLAMAILNSYKLFWPSALGALLYNACVIVFGTFFELALHTGVAGFAFGTIIGAAVNFLVQIPALRRLGGRYHFSLDWRLPGVRRIIWLAVPMILSMLLNQIPIAIYSSLSSALPDGTLSGLTRAYRLFQLPIGIFALSVALAVFPNLTEQAALRQWGNLRQTASKAVRMVILITVPVSVGMVVLRYPLIRLLFQHGAFTARDTTDTTIPLFYFCLGITAQAVINILPRVFYALQDTWTPVLLGSLSMAVNIVAMYVLVKPLGGGGLALATSVTGVVNMLLLFAELKRRLHQIDGVRMLWTTVQSVAASMVMGGVVWVWSAWLTRFAGTGTAASGVVLVTGSALGAAVFAAAAWLMRMEEFNQVWIMVRRRLRLG